MVNRATCRNALALAVMAALTALSSPAVATSVGNLRSVQPAASTDTVSAWDIDTDTGTRLRIDVLRADLIRVQAGRKGVLTSEGSKAASIVLPQPASTAQATLEQDADEIRIRTDVLQLTIQRTPLKLSLARIDYVRAAIAAGAAALLRPGCADAGTWPRSPARPPPAR